MHLDLDQTDPWTKPQPHVLLSNIHRCLVKMPLSLYFTEEKKKRILPDLDDINTSSEFTSNLNDFLGFVKVFFQLAGVTRVGVGSKIALLFIR